MFADWNLPAAEAELATVREKDATVLNILANLRAIQGRWDESDCAAAGSAFGSSLCTLCTT